MDIRIALGSSTPLYWQIVDQVCQAVAAGTLTPGDALPSIRALAERLVINPNTVARAYADLQQAGVVEAQRGRGLFVAERRAVFSGAERERRMAQALDVFMHEVRLLDLPAEAVVEAVRARLAEPAGAMIGNGTQAKSGNNHD